jgi:glycosyltransferase involved in cell wall biosynthesis
MLVSIIIPCFNEIKTIEEIITKILAQKSINKEIILINDGSTDGTKELIEKKLNDKCNIIIHHETNFGKGAAIKSGIKKTNGQIILIQDADLEYDPNDYKKIIDQIIYNKKLVVYGSRVLNKKRYKNKNFTSIYRIFFNHILTIISNIINNQKLTDAHTCYKAFHKTVINQINLEEDDFSFCPEITTKISKLGYKIKEVEISYQGREYKEGKKIKFYDGVKALYVLIKYRFLRK